MSRLYLFRIDYSKDIARLQEMGAPVDEESMPTREYEFAYWTKKAYSDLFGPYKLAL